MRHSVIALITLIAATAAVASCATKKPEPTAQAPSSETTDSRTGGLDARLTDYDYPYEVETFSIESQREKLEMAYMDIEPEEPNGETVLLLHGKNFSGAYWSTTIEPLVKDGYRVVAPDQIGFGKSSKPRAYQFSFHALAANTRALLDELGIDRVSVVGHSMGGMLATRFALMYPKRTTGLVLVNPIGLEDWKLVVPYQTIDTWYASELKKTPDKIRAYMKASYFDGQWKPQYDVLAELQTGWTQGPDYDRIAWVSALTYDMIFTQPVLYEFGELEVPALLIIGDRDRTALGKNLVEPEVAETMGLYGELARKTDEAIPNSKLVLLEGIGHIPQYEAHDRYIGALRSFLSAGGKATE